MLQLKQESVKPRLGDEHASRSGYQNYVQRYPSTYVEKRKALFVIFHKKIFLYAKLRRFCSDII